MGVTTFCHEVFLPHPSVAPVIPQAISSSPLLQDKGYPSFSPPIISILGSYEGLFQKERLSSTQPKNTSKKKKREVSTIPRTFPHRSRGQESSLHGLNFHFSLKLVVGLKSIHTQPSIPYQQPGQATFQRF